MKPLWIISICLALLVGCADENLATNSGNEGGDRPDRSGHAIHETYIYGQNEFAAGSAGALRVMVKRAVSLSESLPTAGADVAVRLCAAEGEPRVLYEGKTGEMGEARVQFRMPELEEGSYTLEVVTASRYGEETVREEIQVSRRQKILLVTDKPIYQPGQDIHLRALALQRASLQPMAGEQLLFEVEDSKSNKVFKRRVPTGDYGVAHAVFTLADEVNTGAYRIRATLGDTQVEKTVTVEKYVLPKFRVDIATDNSYFLAKEVVRGKVQADYFFGKAVSGGQVKLSASTFDVQFEEFFKIEGETGEDGSFAFEFQLPDYFVGQPLERGDALLKLDVELTDRAEHTEKKTATYPVAQNPIRVAAVPESGRLVPGVENRVYIVTTYPDGAPAVTRVEAVFAQETLQAQTDAGGIAVLTVQAGESGESLQVKAQDAKGARAEREFSLDFAEGRDTVLLRPDNSIYSAGETMHFEVLSSFSGGAVYLDLIKERQTVYTGILKLRDGRGRIAIEAAGDMFGTLECHAYKLLPDGNFVRDTRLIYVQPPSSVQISVQPDRETYRPGEDAVLSFVTTDKQGQPVPAALGVTIVDEAVYALQEMQPGLEKVYFTLEEELSQPQYQIEYGPPQSLPGLVMQERYAPDEQKAAAVLLAAADSLTDYSWERNPAVLRKRELQARLEEIFDACVRYTQNCSPGRRAADGEWGYRPDLMQEMVDRGELAAESLRYPFGALDLSTLSELDQAFSYTVFAALESMRKIQKAHEVFYRVWSRERGDPKSIDLDRLVGLGEISRRDLVDGWGNSLRCRFDSGNNQFYSWELRSVVIYSAGPDAQFDTDDDLACIRGHQLVSYLCARGIESELIERIQPAMPEFVDVEERFAFAARGGGPPGMAVPTAVDMDDRLQMKEMPQSSSMPASGPASGEAPPRIREYFPETLLFEPCLITDERGHGKIELQMADSITTWRLTGNASTRGGLLGGTTSSLKVFQDFFVDIDFPVALTQNDEVSVPVAIFNYLPERQQVRLAVTREDWFELLDSEEKQVVMEPKEVGVVYFRIRAQKIGNRRFTVMAYGSEMSDAVRRQVEVTPDGKRFESAINGRLSQSVEHEVIIPENSIPEASKILVKCYPGVGAVLVEGLDGLLRLPGG